MSRKVLVVDDEAAIRRLLVAVLARGGFEAIEAANGREALAALAGGGAEAIGAAILDLRLPDLDGMELIPRVTAAGVAVLVLSAQLDAQEKVAALDLGAEDYVTKPFDGDELLARLRVLLRRYGRSAGARLHFADIAIDREAHRVEVAGVQVALTPREFALLERLVEGGGRILTHRALLESVWGPAHGEDLDYLRVAIRALRRKIEDDPARPRRILNEPGIGYRLASDAANEAT
ncbi:response regulator transcription factor [Novosphingobium profundi]|uniref:response regulator n=1 Tax=Novosphingobium profundi TaxID=1774954 RepID=UPI001BDA385F|nr:response regulator transcription factor [Novosphingobium profundi]MBT0669191.1 response regulator transcription factor [Novosphingobium profundi]